MVKEDRIKLYKKAIDTWGKYAQTNMLYEEIGELLSAIAKYIRGRVTEDDVITEIADVNIMTEQMAVMFGYEKVETEKERKLKRLEERLDNKK